MATAISVRQLAVTFPARGRQPAVAALRPIQRDGVEIRQFKIRSDFDVEFVVEVAGIGNFEIAEVQAWFTQRLDLVLF